jgi:hypothetical protein
MDLMLQGETNSDQHLGAIESKGYEFLANGNTSHIPAESHQKEALTQKPGAE